MGSGGTVSSTLVTENSSTGLNFLAASGSTHSVFKNGTQSLLFLGTDGVIQQNNLNTGYEFINGDVVTFFGTFSFAGERFENGTEAFYNGVADTTSAGGSTQSSMFYVDSSKAVTYRSIASQTDFVIDAIDFSGTGSINCGVIVNTQSIALGWQSDIINSIEVDQTGIINLLTSTSSDPTFRIVDGSSNIRLQIDAQGEFLQENEYGFQFYNTASGSTPVGFLPGVGMSFTNSSSSYWSVGITDATSLGGEQHLLFNI